MTGEGRAARRFAVGSYTPDGPGPGVHVVERSVDGDWSIVASAEASNPSFLAVHDDLWFAVGEDASGSLRSFRLVGNTLTPVDAVEHGEGDPCHVVVDATRSLVLIANYSGGSVTVVPFASGGTLGTPRTLALPHRTGPVTGRQDGPHAHQIAATPWGTHLVSDLGGDAVHEFTVETADAAVPTLRVVRSLDLPAGTGPRHMVLTEGVLHVIGELDGRLHTFAFDATEVSPLGSAAAVLDPDAEGDVYPSHLDLAPSGRLLTTLVRGRDTVAVFDAARREAQGAGVPRLAAEHPLGTGTWPRHHAHLDDRTVVVAAQFGNALIELDLVTGALREALALRAPSCVVPLA
ncbi:lactonase family protein [Agromyces marinus]|uniref:6-phosphogluconolactonase, cycloisomerase 2 family n=1 Tax=Agromyces marinus TaxID=1389020 RepID=A0ABN6YEQ4_9MICO|nr:beta-propeller fold lactonase family protein [Agromyces marinus]UIP57367.1 6-phosphogluconolactonase [Agromyces marinus]BDZ54525.1 hypothetical protein GCM10025870_15980 [Agromyces marinus]